MPEEVKKLTQRVNVIVLSQAKEILVGYKAEKNYASLDDALSGLLFDYKELTERNKELEAKISELEAKR
jgi:hypothetical protein